MRSVLIEKFVKVALFEGSLMVRHPFTIKARGSYFDENNNVDRQKNQEAAWHVKAIRETWQENTSGTESIPTEGSTNPKKENLNAGKKSCT